MRLATSRCPAQRLCWRTRSRLRQVSRPAQSSSLPYREQRPIWHPLRISTRRSRLAMTQWWLRKRARPAWWSHLTETGMLLISAAQARMTSTPLQTWREMCPMSGSRLTARVWQTITRSTQDRWSWVNCSRSSWMDCRDIWLGNENKLGNFQKSGLQNHSFVIWCFWKTISECGLWMLHGKAEKAEKNMLIDRKRFRMENIWYQLKTSQSRRV